MNRLNLILATALCATVAVAQTPAGPKLYIMDCGTVAPMNPELYDLKAEEIKGPKGFVTPCYLVVHPRGTLVWDVGQIADQDFPAAGGPITRGSFTATKKLLPQLAEVGYQPASITYFALSHYHSDHTANANAFAASTWIVQESERTAMFAERAPGITQRASYDKLQNSKTMLLKGEDKDVFGDGTVVIKYAPGHTPGHQMLFVKLAKTGPVLLAGDLFHYPEERSLDRVPGFDADREQTRRTRRNVEDFLKQTGGQLWIQHDTTTLSRLNKSPAFYD